MGNLRSNMTDDEWDESELKYMKNENNLDEAIMIDNKLKETVRKTPNDQELGEELRKRITRKEWDKMSDSLIGEKKDYEKSSKTDPIVEVIKYLNRYQKILGSGQSFDFNNEHDLLESYELESFIKQLNK